VDYVPEVFSRRLALDELYVVPRLASEINAIVFTPTYRRKREGEAEEGGEGEEVDGGCSRMSSIQNHTEAVIVWGRTRRSGSSCIHLADHECAGRSGRYKLPIDITRTGHSPRM
jgi:hypothetical protein